ncbi:MAG: pyruvate, water dikinase regulatory protein [Candidatus Pelagibacter sp.]
MINTYDIYLISDSTGETLERIFLAIKAQFKNFKYKTHFYSFTRTENQISKILEASEKNNNVIVLYTIVDNKLARHLSNECNLKNIPCFGILGDLIISFSKLLDQKALNVPSRQHVMDDEYYKKIEAIQFTMNHDDGNSVDDIEKSDIILLGVSRTSKTPTSIYLANKGMKISNVPLVNENSVPDTLKKNPQKKCVVGLTAEPDRLVDLRKNRMQSIKDNENTEYTNLETVRKEMEDARKLFQKYKWPSIDVTRKSVEETAASVLKIHDIFNQK